MFSLFFKENWLNPAEYALWTFCCGVDFEQIKSSAWLYIHVHSYPLWIFPKGGGLQVDSQCIVLVNGENEKIL